MLVTGSSRGLGRGIALALAREGMSVAIHYVSDAAAAGAAAGACRELAPGGKAFPLVQGDVATAAGREQILEQALGGLGGLDAVVFNAGIAPAERRDLVDATEESFDRVLDVNLKGPHFLAQLVARRWLDSGDAPGKKLVFVGSISATTVSVTRAEYCVSKAGLAMVSRAWAARLAGAGVQCVEVRPGIMKTDMTASVASKYEGIVTDGTVVPQERWGTPEDVGRTVASFLRGDLPFTTGTVIHVDGGFDMRQL